MNNGRWIYKWFETRWIIMTMIRMMAMGTDREPFTKGIYPINTHYIRCFLGLIINGPPSPRGFPPPFSLWISCITSTQQNSSPQGPLATCQATCQTLEESPKRKSRESLHPPKSREFCSSHRCNRVEKKKKHYFYIMEDGHQPNSWGLYTNCKDSLYQL